MFPTDCRAGCKYETFFFFLEKKKKKEKESLMDWKETVEELGTYSE